MVNNFLLKHIYDIRKNTQNKFDVENKEYINDTIGELSRLIFQKFFCLENFNKEFDIKLFESLALYVKSVDILISAFHLIRQRAFTESLALLRISLETCCTALYIFEDNKAYERFVINNNFQSKYSIKHTKKQIPIVDKLWVALSKSGVHTNTIFFGSEKEFVDNVYKGSSISIELEEIPDKYKQDRKFLILLSLISNIILKISELCFFSTTTIIMIDILN